MDDVTAEFESREKEMEKFTFKRITSEKKKIKNLVMAKELLHKKNKKPQNTPLMKYVRWMIVC